MNFDFSALLVFLTFTSGIIWAADAWYFKARRNSMTDTGTGQKGDDNKVAPEPLMVDYARSFFPVFFIVLVLRSFIVEPFRIPSASMMPTLMIGDFILVNKYAYGIRLPVLNRKVIGVGDPQRGDVMVFRFPKDPAVDYIKRVVGLPGDHVVYRNKTLYINGQKIPQIPEGSYIGVGSGLSMSGADIRREALGEVKHDILVVPRVHGIEADTVVPKGHYFVMGDNRDNSNDSRYWGFVPDENLVGRAFMIWMNWDSAAAGVGWDRIGDSIN